MNIDQLKFPIGHFSFSEDCNAAQMEQWKSIIAAFPKKIDEATQNLSSTELNWKYRPEGWSIKQVVHHLADSHMNSLIRFKLTLTEDTPTIRPYEESKWAELPDGLNENIHSSILILQGVHERWTVLLDNINNENWNRMFFHPENQKLITLKEALGLYSWHCEHHLAHINQALQHKGEFNL